MLFNKYSPSRVACLSIKRSATICGKKDDVGEERDLEKIFITLFWAFHNK